LDQDLFWEVYLAAHLTVEETAAQADFIARDQLFDQAAAVARAVTQETVAMEQEPRRRVVAQYKMQAQVLVEVVEVVVLLLLT
jgi:hypothetical protein